MGDGQVGEADTSVLLASSLHAFSPSRHCTGLVSPLKIAIFDGFLHTVTHSEF